MQTIKLEEELELDKNPSMERAPRMTAGVEMKPDMNDVEFLGPDAADLLVPPRIIHVFTKMDEYLKVGLRSIFQENEDLIKQLTSEAIIN